MKILSTFVLVLGLMVTTWFIYTLDHWLGLVAYSTRYLLFCGLFGLMVHTSWACAFRKPARWPGILAFLVLVSVMVYPPPSERILRTVMVKVRPGTSVHAIERIVKEHYEGSRFVIPQITREDTRVHVSLINQQPGNCSAVTFMIEDGVVVRRSFSAD